MRNFDNFNDVTSDLYDPGNDYDPDNATGPAVQDATQKVNTARPGQKMQINVTIINSTASALPIELFSALDSATTRRKPELVVGNYAMHPATSLEGIARIAANTQGVIGFNEAGNLEIRGNAGDPVATVGCGEYPYVSLFESSKIFPFNVVYIRYTVKTNAQIDNNLVNFTRTFAGAVNQNVINPRAYFKPNQFQTNIIDILAPFKINGESGLLLTVNATETVTLGLFIQRWARPSM